MVVNMYDDIIFLDYLYQSVRISQETIGQVLKLYNLNEQISQKLKEQIKNYIKIANSARTMLQRRKKEAKDIGVIGKMVAYASMKKGLNKSATDGEITDFIIQESKMQIEELNKKIGEVKIKSKSITNLARKTCFT